MGAICERLSNVEEGKDGCSDPRGLQRSWNHGRDDVEEFRDCSEWSGSARPEQPRCHHFLGKKALPWPISWLSSDWQRSAPLAPEHQELIFPFRIDLTGFFGKGADARGQGGNIYLN